MDAHDILAAKLAEMKLAGEPNPVVELWFAAGARFIGVIREIHADSFELQRADRTSPKRPPTLAHDVVIVNRFAVIAAEIKDYYK